MRITSTTAPVADPIEWLFYEQRGSVTSTAGRYEQTTLEYWAAGEGQEATLTDGRMTYAHDPGTVERWYYSIPGLMRDGVDPDAAVEDARRGAASLVTELERGIASGGLDRHRIVNGSRPPREPDQVDVWIRRVSGARERFIVPVIGAGGGLLADAIAAAARFATTLRRDYVELDPAQLQRR